MLGLLSRAAFRVCQRMILAREVVAAVDMKMDHNSFYQQNQAKKSSKSLHGLCEVFDGKSLSIGYRSKVGRSVIH